MGELKPDPCPFCGSNAKLGGIRDGQQVFCTGHRCFARGPAVFHGPDGWEACERDAITAWNTRPRTEGRGEGEPVAWIFEYESQIGDDDPSWEPGVSIINPAGKRAYRTRNIRPLYASPIREPEAVEVPDEIEMLRIFKAAGCRTRADFAKAAAKACADAILNLAPVGADPMDLPPAEQFALATKLAANVGYELTPEPEHPDSPHARHPVGGRGEEGSSQSQPGVSAVQQPASSSAQHSDGTLMPADFVEEVRERLAMIADGEHLRGKTTHFLGEIRSMDHIVRVAARCFGRPTLEGDREGYGTERPMIAGEGSRDEPSSSNLNEESQTNGS